MSMSAAFAMLAAAAAAPSADPAEQDQAAINLQFDARPVTPLVEEPLVDPQMSRIGDFWYLTGTIPGATGVTIPLWRSTDLQTWRRLPDLWDGTEKTGHWSDAPWPLPGHTLSDKTRTIVAPELHAIGGALYLAFSYDFGGIHVLRSDSGQPEGPWHHHARLTEFGRHPTLFQDDDGSVWLAFDGGTVARLSPDLTKIEGKIERLVPAHDAPPKKWGLPPVLDRIGTSGGQILKRDGKYLFVAAAPDERLGATPTDMFVAESEGGPAGPYTRRYLAVTHGGAGQLVTMPGGKLAALVAATPGDENALLPGKTALVPLETNAAGRLRPDGSRVLEAGPAGSLLPVPSLAGEAIRDPSIALGADGWYYLVGTKKWGWELPKGGIELWRSRDLKDWQYRGFAWKFSEKDLGVTLPAEANPKLWAPEIFWSAHDKAWYLTFSIWTGSGQTWLFKSKTDRAEGPYESVTDGPLVEKGIDGFLFENGADLYYFYGGCQLQKLNARRNGFADKYGQQRAAGGVAMGYEGCSALKIGDRFYLFGTDWSGSHEGTYDLYYATSDSPTGPWSERRFAVPHAGHATVFQGKGGQVYTTMFGSDTTAPYHMRLGVLALEFDADGKPVPRPVGPAR
ncbi:Glycosyl hydrolases family 43 [Tsuneonella dongtanensis]|uniref:Glycosyl hydrolases family 43 n=1 Tax=Tsuneonella dongtanensis TaxID=692370 RepID=A0A1B2AB10_9SPHN|nr:family 43 glycosylhydrolase [Tsuneonella dongtanensis]ANY19349.1 Glycosyl hydrolases family 43 [Tsuneonella dongtanensis]